MYNWKHNKYLFTKNTFQTIKHANKTKAKRKNKTKIQQKNIEIVAYTKTRIPYVIARLKVRK